MKVRKFAIDHAHQKRILYHEARKQPPLAASVGHKDYQVPWIFFDILSYI